ncbi:MAG TPA: hypothetical protein VK511_06460, partial [Gemmatimonadaceae bacterium]|nr:hypothetical protein [Gemmatimonadaceae bacterium]
MIRRLTVLLSCSILLSPGAHAQSSGAAARTIPSDEDGHELWMRYRLVSDPVRLAEYRTAIRSIVSDGASPTLDAARAELKVG